MKWVKIFGTGARKEKDGTTRFFSADDLERIAVSYNPNHHEAPIAIPPVTSSSPAWGWVAGLKKVGEYLYAQFKQVHPKFQEMLDGGEFSGQQISLYPNGTLRSVLFTGAKAPYVPMLSEFEDFNGTTYQFSETDFDDSYLLGAGGYSEDESTVLDISHIMDKV